MLIPSLLTAQLNNSAKPRALATPPAAGVPNSSLSFSSISVNGTSVSLGGSVTTTAAGTNITASTLVTNFRGYATLLSRIRSVRLLKWYQIQGDVRNRLDYDQTNMTNLKSDYAADMSSVGAGTLPASGNTVTASDLDTFVSSLQTAIQNNRTNTVLVEEFYCHSNCHGSCHGSL